MTRDRLISLFGVLMILFFSPAFAQASSNFMDPEQPMEARVRDLIKQLTLEEKVSLLSYDAAAVPRLGVPKYNYRGEALHSVVRAGKATVFPQAIAMANRTYRYMTEEPLYPFGFGLSYTTFQYSESTVSSKNIQAGDGLTCRVNVTNTGNVTADEVAQLYLRDLEASVAVPQHALKGFQKVTLEPGQTKTVAFRLRPEDIALVNELGQRVIEPGEFKITVGGCSPGTRGVALGASSAVETQFEVAE